MGVFQYEKREDGHYIVRDANGIRLGLVLGGHGRWLAETMSGSSIGQAKSREDAANLLLQRKTTI